MQPLRITLILLLAAALAWFTPVTGGAAPALQGEGFVSSPRPNAVVRGVVSIEGTATHPEFQKYEVRLAAGLNPNVPDGQWIRLNISESQVVNGQLAVWDTSAVPDGAYILRLRVVRLDSNYQDVDIAPINVANAAPPTAAPTATPAPSPTPESSPTPEITPTSFVPGATITPFGTSAPDANGTPGAVATLPPSGTVGAVGTLPASTGPSPTPILIDQPTIIVPTSTPDPEGVAVAPLPTRDGDSGGSGDDDPFGIPGLPTDLPAVEAGTFMEPLVYGAAATVGVFVVIGLLYLVRALLRTARR